MENGERNNKMRKWFIWVAFTLLVSLSLIVAAWFYLGNELSKYT
jgi:hypothetical protein